MAVSKSKGAAARPNSPQELTREGDTDHHAADGLAGMTWWNALAPQQRATALAAAQTAVPAHAAAAPEHAATLRDLDGWMAASGMDEGHPWRVSIAQTLANEPPAGMPVAAPPAWAPAAKRVSLAREALFQALQIADLLIGALDRDRHDESALHLGLTVRVRELTDAADLLLTNPDCCDEEDAIPAASRMIFGPCYRPRAAGGNAS